ncbi:GH116 family glycosyl-hydrolase [Flavihumibacter solisilvae]|uniref:GH116 family glycosyl-hydrolase n=1 Tax=Flavihumibacter solisilvae TaxID=1349421 RepID=UPI000B1F0741|nr:GH116 family glycosyl-hydrolase [Flavihumibacter solisilvae]
MKDLSRRKFLRNGSLGSASLLLFNLPAWAREITSFIAEGQFAVHNIPADKNLDPAWVRSLYKRTIPSTYFKSLNELKFIGMPAGGLHAGTVYLGGDGRLWLWGIYNDSREGVDPKTVLWNDGTREVSVRNRDGANYVEPTLAANRRVLEQGFAISFDFNWKKITRELKEEDWDEIKFEASYPQATIRYISKGLPVEVVVKAGAIFIPLDADNSALPATVFSINVQNRSTKRLTVSIGGWFENGANKITAKDADGMRQNVASRHNGFASIKGQFLAAKPDASSQRDSGTTCITCMGKDVLINTSATPWPVTTEFFTATSESPAEANPNEKLVSSLVTNNFVEPGAGTETNFILSWHFNHPLLKLDKLPETQQGYYYGKRFRDAAEVGAYIAANFKKLHGNTLLWQKTYYDSTLPHWFLERCLLNIGTLATANTYRFANDRFWGWEGVNACEGTCTHVWQYAQTMGRIFPSLERDARQRTDLGIALQQDGGIIFRAEYESRPAIDGQAGTLLRIYREHQVSADDHFLKTNWPNVKRAAIFMLAQDKNGDGMTDTPMENTLDAVWEGEIAWIVGLCIAAAKATQYMAEEVGDMAFADQCREYVEKGNRNMAEKLFNGEYFIHRPDGVLGKKKLGSYNTCHIDQVYGQSWAWQVGLGRLWDREKTLSALRSLWKYNFAPDVGPYIKTHTGGRPYALAGEAGMVMNTNPKNEPFAYGENMTWQLGYFHECMSGFEHQVASHLMAEGMTDEALILTRAIHDRYHAAKRNPYNEIECSDHYARAMASYGTFISACGFEYHGPNGYIRFAPKWSADNFKAPFTAAEGWGSYSQKRLGNSQVHTIEVKYGILQLSELGFDWKVGLPPRKSVVTAGNEQIAHELSISGTAIRIKLSRKVVVKAGLQMIISIN